MKAKINRILLEALFDGDKRRATAHGIRIQRIPENIIRCFICNYDGEELILLAEAEIDEGSSMTLYGFDRLFDIKITKSEN